MGVVDYLFVDGVICICAGSIADVIVVVVVMIFFCASYWVRMFVNCVMRWAMERMPR